MRGRWKLAAVALVVVVTAAALKAGGDGRRGSSPRPLTARPPPAAPPAAIASGAPANAGAAAAGTRGAEAGQTSAWVLPGPSRYVGTAGVGFPHTTLGAVALGYSALVARFTTDPDLAVTAVRATTLATTPALLRRVAQGTQTLRTRFGLPPTGPTPTTIGLSLIACRVDSEAPAQVVAGYEGTLTVEGGSVAGTTAEVSVAIRLAWDGTDWKIDPTADLPTPGIVFPSSTTGPPPEGWHVCSQV